MRSKLSDCILGLVVLCATLVPAHGWSAQDAAPAAKNVPTAEAAPLQEPDPDPWPRTFEADGYTIAIFPPQVDSWEGQKLKAACAVEITKKGEERRVYGVVEFEARTRVDKESRLVVVDEFQMTGASLPNADKAKARLLGVLQNKFGNAFRIVALDRLEAALEIEKKSAATSLSVKNDPPKVVFAERPTLLVTVDGAPVWRKIEGSSFERLLNTRPLVLKDGAGSSYLHLFDGWLAAPNLAGPWKPLAIAPPGIWEAQQATVARQPADLLEGGSTQEVDAEGQPIEKPTLARGPVPDLRVVTEPTELVVLDGAVKWEPIAGTALEYAANTSGNLFRTSDQKIHYVLPSGRWFAAATLAGPWSWVPQAKLAADFAKIPDDSPKENVKASVSGTAQAEEARIADSIPQTSEVTRAEAKFEPAIDGEPRFAPIEGTSLAYVKNSATPILRVGDQLYALCNGVWFVAPAVKGPWSVAAKVPDVVYTIPSSSPLHYVTYVRVYAADDKTVVVGYTPGYYGTVVADDVVIYGTGYVCDPWVGTTWYGCPATYGYGSAMTYSPWSGWAVSFGVGWAWGYWGGWYAPYYAPYWGAYYGYYPYYGGAVVGPGGGWAAWGPGGWAGTTGNIYRQWGSVSTVSRYSGGYNAWTGNAWRSQVGASYNSRTGNLAAGQRGAVGNIYTGQYAYGGRGAVHNTQGGGTVAGGRVTMGDVDSGRQVTAGRVGGYNPNTGQSGSAGWVRGENGAVVRAGDDIYGAKDGNVYKRNGQGDWSQVDGGGNWSGVSDRSRTQQLDRQYGARSAGNQRYGNYRASAPRGGGGGRRR